MSFSQCCESLEGPTPPYQPTFQQDQDATFASSARACVLECNPTTMKESIATPSSRITVPINSLGSIPSLASDLEAIQSKTDSTSSNVHLYPLSIDQENGESTLFHANESPIQARPFVKDWHKFSTPIYTSYPTERTTSSPAIGDDPVDSISRSFDAYTIIGTIGRGNHGKVVLAYLSDDRMADFTFYAIKIVPRNRHTPETQNELTVLRVISEGSLVGSIVIDPDDDEDGIWRETGSRFLQQLFEVFYDQDHCFIVMEYHPATLSNPEISARFRLSHLAANPLTFTSPSLPLDISRNGSNQQVLDQTEPTLVAIRLLAAEIALGLMFLHKRGIVHQDIKPDNIMISHNGHAIIGDFGAASQCEEVAFPDDGLPLELEGPTFGSIVLGSDDYVSFTPSYAAPELRERNDHGCVVYDTRADWWSLGFSLHEVVTGSFPFPTEACASRCSEGDLSLSFGGLEGIERVLTKYGYIELGEEVSTLREFLQRLLVDNRDDRLVGAEALLHPFFAPLADLSLWDEIAEGRHPPCPNPETTNLVDERDRSYILEDGSEETCSTRSSESAFYSCNNGQSSLMLVHPDYPANTSRASPPLSNTVSTAEDGCILRGIPSSASMSPASFARSAEDVFVDSAISMSHRYSPCHTLQPTIVVSPPKPLKEEDYVLTLPDWITDQHSNLSSPTGTPYLRNTISDLPSFRPQTPREKLQFPCFLGSPFEESTPAAMRRRDRSSSLSDTSSSYLLRPPTLGTPSLLTPHPPTPYTSPDWTAGYSPCDYDEFPEMLTVLLLQAMDARDRHASQTSSYRGERLYKLHEMVKKRQKRLPRKLKKSRSASAGVHSFASPHTHGRKVCHSKASIVHRFWGCMRFWMGSP